ALVAVLYLGLRLDVLLHPPQGVSTYAFELAVVPRRWIEYQVFPWALGVNEIHVLALASAWRWGALLLLFALLVASLWRSSRRLALAGFGGGVLALAPVLVLPFSSNQYGYGFIAVACGVLALALP